MPPVKKSTEQKFLNGLKGLFGGLAEKVKAGKVTAGNAAQEAKRLMGSKKLDKQVGKVVSAMVNAERQETAASWRDAVMKNSGGPEMYQAIQHELQGPVGKRIQEIIAENAQYISIFEDWRSETA